MAKLSVFNGGGYFGNGEHDHELETNENDLPLYPCGFEVDPKTGNLIINDGLKRSGQETSFHLASQDEEDNDNSDGGEPLYPLGIEIIGGQRPCNDCED